MYDLFKGNKDDLVGIKKDNLLVVPMIGYSVRRVKLMMVMGCRGGRVVIT